MLTGVQRPECCRKLLVAYCKSVATLVAQMVAHSETCKFLTDAQCYDVVQTHVYAYLCICQVSVHVCVFSAVAPARKLLKP